MSTLAAQTYLSPSKPANSLVAERWYSEKRLGGLSRFAFAITVLNLAGHLFLGFEQSWVTPLVALAAAYGTELLGETVDALANDRRPRYRGSALDVVKFLLSAHITGLAVGMLLYASDQLWPVAFAASSAIASKYVFRVAIAASSDKKPQLRHFLNPSNFGITITLLLLPLVSIAPPYQFTENTWGIVDWILPLIVICTGSYLNTKATGRIPLILAWVACFALQALLRSAIHGSPWNTGLMPMTGFAFILFTFYMITDPATSPVKPVNQVIFGCSVALLYGIFMELHIVFGLFYALTIVTAARGGLLYFKQRSADAASNALATTRGRSPAVDAVARVAIVDGGASEVRYAAQVSSIANRSLGLHSDKKADLVN